MKSTVNAPTSEENETKNSITLLPNLKRLRHKVQEDSAMGSIMTRLVTVRHPLNDSGFPIQ